MKQLKSIALITALIGLFVSCKHTNKPNGNGEQIGPSICVPADFTVSNYTVTSSIDFTSNSNQDLVSIKADLSHIVSWQVEIKGKTTGAVKQFSGKSSNINISWNGVSDSLQFFGIEDCNVNLKFSCYSMPTKVLSIVKPTNFLNAGLLISDFDGRGTNGATKLSWAVGSFNCYGDRIYDSLITGVNSRALSVISPQGGNYFYMKSYNEAGGYYTAGCQISDKGLGGYIVGKAPSFALQENSAPVTIAKYFGNNITTDELYFNVLVHNTNSKETNFGFYFKEYIPFTTGSTKYKEGTASYSYNLKVPESNEWQYQCIKLSDFLNAGLKLADPKKIFTMGIDYQSSTAGPQTVAGAVDLIIITKGEPLFPKLVKK